MKILLIASLHSLALPPTVQVAQKWFAGSMTDNQRATMSLCSFTLTPQPVGFDGTRERGGGSMFSPTRSN